MPTGFGIAEKINEITEKYNLILIKIIRMGTRFFIGLYKKNDKKVLLKISLGHARESYDFKRVCKRLSRESKFLDFLSHHKDSILKKAVSKIIDFETDGYAWYLKEYLEASPQNINRSNFLFRKDFFDDKASTFLAQFFSKLHKISYDFPLSFKKMIRRYPLESHERFIHYNETLDYYGLGHLREKIKKFLNSKRKIFDKNQNVVAHFEPYPSHILKDKENSFYFIDWENVGWASPFRDIVILWIRAFKYPVWQNNLIENFLKFSFSEHKKYFKELFEVEVILQSLCNMNYFKWTKDKDELKVRDKALEFFKENVRKALEGRLL